MAKVLLTGGSGFVGAHILNTLLERGYSITTTVRSSAKGDKILASHNLHGSKLSYVVVNDIADEGAFDLAVRSTPSFDYVIHTASPFPVEFTDPVKDVLTPAIKGTIGILRAVKSHAPSVKRVVVTSSFAAIVNPAFSPKIYDETSWNPVTWEQAVADRSLAYRGSKAFAEKAAWEFMEKEKPGFDLVTINPPLVYGPVAHHLESLSGLNTSNQRIRDFVQGKHTGDELPPTGTFLWVDVRDLALAHVRALEVSAAGGHRFFTTAGHCSHKRIVDAIRESYPELSYRLPKNPIDDFPEDCYGYDNGKVRDILGIEFHSLQQAIRDTVASLLRF
ncbi:SDR family oxidoreductase [Aspergillus lucknowensis]|uniref:NAD(P)-binding protein n=1 Tax=Aspergillus lucknowensis TaxID=176173 RepID=A0ABR4LHP5_9EURO